MSVSGSRILVVDDEASNLKVLQRMLGKAGYEVSTAGSGPEALKTLRDAQPKPQTGICHTCNPWGAWRYKGTPEG